MPTLKKYITEKHWGPDDNYLVIPMSDIQVFEGAGLKPGDIVWVSYSYTREEPNEPS